MAGEIQASVGVSGGTMYVLIRDRIGRVWNTSSQSMENYQTANYANYTVSATEQGSASAYYVATFPAAIPPGVYSITMHQQQGGSPAETDRRVAMNDYQWGGSATLPLSDLVTSGQLSQIGPIRIAKGVMIQNFPIYLKSSADHVTPFTSGVVSGQISRDGGAFGALQSGGVLEVGLGWYKVPLTSGDLNANTVALLFTANGISGGSSDPLPLGVVTQRVSGSL